MYAIGETVFFVERYPKDESRPFGKRTIVDAYDDEDGDTCYVFDSPARVGKDTWIGCDNRAMDTDGYRPARNEDIHKEGDMVDVMGVDYAVSIDTCQA